jgi:Ca2+-binding EF-hand superfamily protein
MKGLQGERLRQAFKYLDADQDGFIRPEQFKRIILASSSPIVLFTFLIICLSRKLLAINFQKEL